MSKRTLLALTLTACAASRAAPPPPVPMHASAPALASSPTAAPATPPAAYPPSRTTDTSDTLFGTVVRDPYRWLEDGDSPEVKGWAQAQDAFARARLDRLPHRDAILARLEALDRAEARGWYLRRPGGRVFFTRRAADQDKWVVVVREANGSERTLIDPNAWPQKSNPSLVEHVVSPDGKKIAYGVSSNNADETTSHVLDVDTGKDLPDLLPGTNFFNVQFNSASDGLYYRYTPPDAKLDAGQRYGLGDLRFHRLGRAATEDVVVHESMRDPYNFLWIGASEDGHWLFATVDHSASILDVYFKDARGPQTSTGWRPLAVGGHASYDVTTYRDRFYVFTNEGASRSRVMVVDPKKPQRDAWKEIVPERADQTLTDVRIVGGKLALTYLEDVISHVEIHELDGRLVREIQAPGVGALSPLVGGMSKDDDTVFYGFESYTSPKELFQTSVRTGVTRSVYRATVPFDGAPYLVEQRFFASKDGTRVPMFILRKRDGDGGAPRSPAPTILYAYGAYGYSETPWFNAHIVPWLEQGGVYAIANVRGGAEYGEAWHQAVVGRGKQLTFDDFAAAAEFLTREGYTTPDKLVIKGGSHGGLLVATELTQRPELFRAVICEVPVIDMIRYTRFGAGKLWVGEIGSPTVEADFRALFAYSPYHHIVPGVAYPSILIASADSDDRVDPLHARKLAAALQGASNGGSVLLRVEHAASHRGSGRRSSNDAQLADEYAFALGEIAARGSVARAGR